MQHGYGELPGEILDVIFGFLHSNYYLYNITQCELVCKNWKLPAQRLLYSEIVFSNAHKVETFISFMMNDRSGSFAGQFTRSIAYNGNLEARDNNLWINAFMDICPHLRHIFSDKDDPECYETLIKAHELGKWTELESIGTCPEEFSDVHNACALQHRETLTILNIYDGHKMRTVSSLYEKLNLFPSVKHLYFGTNKHNFFESAEHVAKNMKNLVHLSFENLQGPIFYPLVPIKSIDLSLITPQPSIKQLVIQGISYESDNFLLYIMKKYPGLQNFKINPGKGLVMRHDLLMEKIKSEKNNFSVPILAKFMAFVSNCYIHSMDFFYTALSTDELLSYYWSLRDPDESKELIVVYSEGEEWLSGELQPIDTDSLVHIRLDLDLPSRKKAVFLNYKPSKISFPHLKIIEKAGKDTDRLVVCIGPVKCINIIDDSSEDMVKIIEGYFFSHIIQHCFRLKTLHVMLARMLLFNSKQYEFINRSITDLNLECVVISDVVLSQISRQIPNLRRLVLKDIHRLKKYNKYTDPNFNCVVDMASTSFRYLHVENYVLDGLSLHNYPTEILVKLTTEDSEIFYKYAPSGRIDYFGKKSGEHEYDKNLIVTRAVQIDEENYYNGLRDFNCFNLHVICISLNYLVVSLEKVNPILSCSILIQDNNNGVSFSSEEKMKSYYMQTNS